MKKFLDVLGRYEKRKLSALEAGESLGCSERQFRRWRDRYEEEGLDGLIDKRLGKASAKPVSADQLAWTLEQYRTQYRGWNVKHFHEHLEKRYGFLWSYTSVKTQLQVSGLIERAPRRGAHRRKRERRPRTGMMLHQDGSRHGWLCGHPALDLIVTMDDATSTIYSMFLVEEEMYGLELAGLVGGFHGARPTVEPLYRAWQPLFLHAGGRWEGGQGASGAGGTSPEAARHRTHSGLFARSAGALGAQYTFKKSC